MKRIPCEVYSRVAGYYRPVTYWNPGKREEFADRRCYEIPEELRRDTCETCETTSVTGPTRNSS